MKLLWLTNYPSPYRVDFFNELGKQLDLTVLFENTIEEQKHREKEWFNRNYDRFKAIQLEPCKGIGKKIGFHRDVISYIKEEYDYILLADYTTITSIICAFYLKLKKKKYGISIDGAFADHNKGIKGFVKRKVISKASYLFSSSKQSDEYLLQLGAKKENIFRYNFSSLHQQDILDHQLEEDEKQTIRSEIGINSKLVVLSVGQFVPGKGIDFILRMAKKLPEDIEYYIVGGIPSDEYNRMVDDLNLTNIHFVGFKKKKDLWKYYLAADVFVFSTRHDYWGLVLNEAMATDNAIVATNMSVAALHFINNGENGYIYEVDNEEQYINAMMHLYSNRKMIRSMAKKNLKIINDYTIEKMANQHYSVFKKMEATL